MVKVAIISNELPPYRVPLFEHLAGVPDLAFHAVFCTRREPNRHWELPALEFPHLFLNQNCIETNGRYIHNNLEVIGALKRLTPDVVINCGFNPTHLYAFAYAKVKGLPHICMTDGTLRSEQTLRKAHRIIRRVVFAHSSAYVYASEGGRALYESYGLDTRRCFKSCLCVHNGEFAPPPEQVEKRFDFIFCGRIEPVKNPLFALHVAVETARKLGRKTSILFVGTGDEEDRVRMEAARHAGLVEVALQGHQSHDELPLLYHAARIFLFPTRWDPWGVVVNEACAAGLPAIISPYSGAAGELVRNGENGFVCDLDVGQWAHQAALLLGLSGKYADFSRRSLAVVNDYNYRSAAAGIVDACRHSLAAAR